MVNEILSDYIIRDPFLKFPQLLGQESWDSSGKGHSCNYLRSNARVGFDPGLYGKRMSKSDLYHLKAFPSCNIH